MTMAAALPGRSRFLYARSVRREAVKRNLRKALFSVWLFCSLAPAVCFSGDASINADGTVTWQAGVDGIQIDWDSTGSVSRVSSRYSTPVEVPDRRGINTAQVIAEEKAKAAIVRFLDQSVTSTRVVTEIDNDVNKATQNRALGGSKSLVKTDQRTLLTNLTEVTTSFAAGKLRGVTVLEKGYDEKLAEAWVVVGISDKTLKGAASLHNMVSGQQASSNEPNVAGSPDDLGIQHSEVESTTQKNW
jgi:hypothetical protein